MIIKIIFIINMAYYLYFRDHLRDARITSLCIRHVPRFESGGAERGWVSHGTAAEMQFQWILLGNKTDHM